MDDKQLRRERRFLVQRLAYWKRMFLRDGGTPEAVAALRLAIELDPQGEGIEAGVPVHAPGHFFPIGPAAKGAALARFCIEHLDHYGTPLWREKRQTLEGLYQVRAVADALAPEVMRARNDLERRRKGGRNAWRAGEPRTDVRERVGKHWERMAQSGVPEHERAGKIVIALRGSGTEISDAQVRTHIRTLGLRKAKGKLA